LASWAYALGPRGPSRRQGTRRTRKWRPSRNRVGRRRAAPAHPVTGSPSIAGCVVS
jgi:hypothetical protein